MVINAGRISLALAAGTCAVALAACGSSASRSTSASAGPALALSECMRSHGVSNFPDPNGGTIQIGPDSGINPFSPAFQSAQHACRKLMPESGSPPQMSESRRLAAVAFSKCMRRHGEPDFPDPMLGAPPATPTRILSIRGMYFVLGAGMNPMSQAFRQAAAACGVRPPPNARAAARTNVA
jgi:hypothetical protein